MAGQGSSSSTAIPKSLSQFLHEARALRLEGLHGDDLHGDGDDLHGDDLHGDGVGTQPPVNTAGGTGRRSHGPSEPDGGISSPEGAGGEGVVKDMLSSFGMSRKKRHEVCLFSELVAREMRETGITQVLDLGSGRGYLSQCLSLGYNLTVVGVDAQQGNTTAAKKRNKKVHKVWMKSTSRSAQHHVTTSRNDISSISNYRSALEEDMFLNQLFIPNPALRLTLGSDNDATMTPTRACCKSRCDTQVGSDKGSDDDGIIESVCRVCEGDPDEICEQPQRTCEADVGTLVPTPANVGTLVPTPVQTLETASRGVKSAVESPSEKRNSPRELTGTNTEARAGDRPSNFCPLTMKLTLASIQDLLRAAERVSQGAFQSRLPCGVVGLHTCGDLTSTALEAFSQVQNVRVVCVVGCCYHHITEVDEENSGHDPRPGAGFPMSPQLKKVSARLGRKARMLACQTLTRFSDTTSGESLHTIFQRAMLQVVFARHFKDVYENRSANLVTGRLKKEVPKDFVSYARILIPRVGLENFEVSNEELIDIEAEFLPMKRHMELYLKLRAVLAPCIESLIILDRLLYLLDQTTVKKAEIRMLFDPAVSPRCTVLIAHKYEEDSIT